MISSKIQLFFNTSLVLKITIGTFFTTVCGFFYTIFKLLPQM